ncbi:MAG: efflux RND transporter periplasmic adaptor subunit [Deltaproteobacteria bacterium]|nr:MAG: efflux RND transporter periplasmic adaptor subunit [Deltaproteobacteria bacterium]
MTDPAPIRPLRSTAAHAMTMLLALAMALATATGCRGASDATAQGPPPQAGAGAGEGPAPTVEVVPARRGALSRTLAFTGEVLADRRVDVVPLESGLLVALEVDEGDAVTRGDVLARLDEDLQDRRRREADAARRSARAAVAQARAERDRQERELERRRRLQERDALPRAEVEALEDQLAVLDAALVAAEARGVESDTALASRRAEVERRVVRAPFDGVVVRRLQDPGAAVSPQQPLLTLLDRESLEFVARLPERRLGELEPGARATITLDAAPDRPLEAELRRLGEDIERGSRTIEARFRIESGDLRIRHGMFGRGRMTLEQREALVHVPEDAVHREADEEDATESVHVWIVRDGQASRATVEVLYRLEGRAALRGIDEGALVIVSPVARLEDGQRVRILDQPQARPGARR